MAVVQLQFARIGVSPDPGDELGQIPWAHVKESPGKDLTANQGSAQQQKGGSRMTRQSSVAAYKVSCGNEDIDGNILQSQTGSVKRCE